MALPRMGQNLYNPQRKLGVATARHIIYKPQRGDTHHDFVTPFQGYHVFWDGRYPQLTLGVIDIASFQDAVLVRLSQFDRSLTLAALIAAVTAWPPYLPLRSRSAH